MKIIFCVILLFISALSADTNDIRVVTTARTNARSGSITTVDIFTRGGKTNLVRKTTIKAGTVQFRLHRFYHDGVLLGDFQYMPNLSGFRSEADSPYSLSFEFGPNKEVKSAIIGTNGGVALDGFDCTNGVFDPMDSSRITKANAIFGDMGKLLAPEHLKTASPNQFRQDVNDFLKEHKDK